MNKILTLGQLASLCGLRGVLQIALGRVLGRKSVRVRLGGSSLPLEIRFNNSDLVLFLGIFLHKDCHLRLGVDPATVLDLGANTGLTAVAFQRQFPHARVIAVEGDRDAFRVCQRNLPNTPLSLSVQRVVAARSGWANAENPDAISMARRFAESEESSPNTIQASAVDELLDEFGCEEPILVKMDIEGAEADIFREPARWLNRVQAVLVEPHGAGTAEMIRRTLEDFEFRVSQVGEKILGTRPPWS